MPTATPASDRGADAKANPTRTSAISRIFFIFPPFEYLTSFRTQSFAGLFAIRSGHIAGHAHVLANSGEADALQPRSFRGRPSAAPAECNRRSPREHRSYINLHLVDQAIV